MRRPEVTALFTLMGDTREELEKKLATFPVGRRIRTTVKRTEVAALRWGMRWNAPGTVVAHVGAASEIVNVQHDDGCCAFYSVHELIPEESNDEFEVRMRLREREWRP